MCSHLVTVAKLQENVQLHLFNNLIKQHEGIFNT